MVTTKGLVFKLFSNCKIVSGAGRSIICDLNGKIFIIPAKYNEYIPLLKENQGIDTNQIGSSEPLKELVNELEYKQMGEYISCEIANNLPNLEVGWNSPFLITNAIVDIDGTNTYNWNKFIKNLDEIGCPFIQLRMFNLISFELLTLILKVIEDTEIYSVQLIIPFNISNSFWNKLIKIIQQNSRIADTIVYNCSDEKLLPNEYRNRIRLTNEVVDGPDSCGKIGPAFFTLKVDNFFESHLYNSCLNKKVAISSNGLVKNCPSMPFDYGNINDVNLAEIVKSDSFQFWWKIKKDNIEVCKDCEFRYVCSDCRAFIVEPNNPYSKPSKCPYDPYTCTGF